jgi:hypothetical protein
MLNFRDEFDRYRGIAKENTSLLRPYFPKGADLSVPFQAHLNKVARQLDE